MLLERKGIALGCMCNPPPMGEGCRTVQKVKKRCTQLEWVRSLRTGKALRVFSFRHCSGKKPCLFFSFEGGLQGYCFGYRRKGQAECGTTQINLVFRSLIRTFVACLYVIYKRTQKPKTNNMKRLTAISFLLMVFFAVQAQMQDPVKFKSELKTGSGPEAEMIFSATIDPGWHVYSTNLGQDGPIEASLHVNKKDGVELVGKLTPKGKEISHSDEMFGMKLRYFENAVQFVQKVKFTKPQYDIDAYLEWGACNEARCACRRARLC